MYVSTVDNKDSFIIVRSYDVLFVFIYRQFITIRIFFTISATENTAEYVYFDNIIICPPKRAKQR